MFLNNNIRKTSRSSMDKTNKSESNHYPKLILSIVTCFYWFSLYSYVPTLSTYAESLGASHKMIGLILGSYGFVQMVIRIPLGIISDKINKRKLFINLGVLLSLIGAAGMAFLKTPAMLLICRSLTGAAAATWVTFTVLYSNYFEAKQAPKAIGFINAFNNIGQITAMLIAGIISTKFGNSSPFIIALVGAAIGLVLSFKVYEKKDISRKPLRVTEVIHIGKNKNLLSVSTLAVLAQLTTFATVFGFTPIAAKNIGASALELNILTILTIIPSMIAAALSGTLFSKHIGERKSIFAGFVLLSAASISIPFINNLKILFISQFVGGFGRGLVFTLLMGLSIKTVEQSRRGTAMGFFQAIYGIGMFLGPVITGVLSDFAGLNWGFWIIGIIGAISSILTLMLLDNHQN